MSQPILFVCLGNICRSPAAEGVFRQMRPGHPVDSAGTGGWHVGEPPHGPMQVAAEARGYDLSPLRARQFVVADFDRFDLILAMDDQNLAEIKRLQPVGNTSVLRRLTDYAPEAGRDHVPDPYYSGDFDGTLDLIVRAVRGLCQSLDEAPDQGADRGREQNPR